MKTNTLIAVAFINGNISAFQKGEVPVRANLRDLVDIAVTFDSEFVVTDARKVVGTKEVGFTIGRDVIDSLVGLDFSGIVGASPWPTRLLELDFAGSEFRGGEVLSAETVKAAKEARKPAPAKEVAKAEAKSRAAHPTAKPTCGAPAFYGPCRSIVAAKGQKCHSHAGNLCGAAWLTDADRTCNMLVANPGDHCALHGGPAKKSGRKTKAA